MLCHPSVPSVASEHGAVRPPVAAEEEQHGEEDGDDDALQHAEGDDTQAGDEREQQRRRPHARVLPEGSEVHEREGSRDHHGGERRLWEIGEQRVEEHEQHDEQTRPDEVGDLSLRTRLLRDGGARPARRDREALEEPCRDVRGADADHLLVGFELVAAPSREARGRRDGVGERDEHDPDRGEQQRAHVAERGPRQGRPGQTARQRADGGHTLACKPEHRRQDRRARHRDEHRGNLPCDPR